MKRLKRTCNYCKVSIRRLGKHINQKHLTEYLEAIGWSDGYHDDVPNRQYEENPIYMAAFHEGYFLIVI